MNMKWLKEKAISRETALNMFIDLLVTNVLCVGLVSTVVFTHGWIWITLFFLGLLWNSMSMASYARRIFPKKRSDKDAKDGKSDRPAR